MSKHGVNCDCMMCKMGKSIGMIKKESSEKGHEHNHDGCCGGNDTHDHAAAKSHEGHEHKEEHKCDHC